ncbi:MAG: GumC family protein [Spirochaetia bacterium]
MSEQDKTQTVHHPGYPQAQYIEEDEIDLLELIGVLWKYKKVIIGITVIAAIAVVVFSIVTLLLPPEINPLPNMYTGRALIHINEQSGGGLSSMLSSSGLGNLASLAGVSAGGSSYGMLAERLLKSRSILDTIAEEFDLTERYEVTEHVRTNTREAMLGNLSIENDAEIGTIDISYSDWDPEVAQEITNRFVELLDQRFATIGINQSMQRKELLEQKLAEIQAELAELEAELREFQTRYGVLTVESLAMEQVTMLARLRSQLIMKEMEINTYSDFARIEDPVLRRLRAERDNLRQLITEMESGYNVYDSNMPSQEELPDIALEFGRLERDLMVKEQVFTMLTGEYEMVKLAVEGAEPIFQVLEMAEAPDKKSGPSRGIICIAVTFGTFFFAIILAFILNAVKNIKNDPERMRKLKGEDV